MPSGEVRMYLKQIYWFIYDNFLSVDEKAKLRDRCKEEIIYPKLKEVWNKLNKSKKEIVKEKFRGKSEEIFEDLEKIV